MRATVIGAAAISGLVGPILFSAVLVALTAVQYDFMLGIDWRPLRDPAGAWPSALALGPYGWVQSLNFVLSGTLLAVFALGLRRATQGGSNAGPVLLFVAGTAMALLAFETDPIRRTNPRTLHGWVHDAAFVLFIPALLAALFSLWRTMSRDPLWRGHARYTFVTGICATLLLSVPGVAYYFFFITVLAWFEVTALRLWHLSEG